MKTAWVLFGLTVGTMLTAMDRSNGVELPEPRLDGDVSLEASIVKRRSVREFSNQPLSLAHIGQLLWAAQGITSEDGGRSAASAGALYPLELYVVAGNIESLQAGLYRYQPRGHRLQHLVGGDLRKALGHAALGQAWVRRAPAVLVIAAVYERSEQKYGQRARRYTRIETGHAAQNVYLQAVALGLGTVIVGAFDDAELQQVLNLPGDHSPLALMPVGHP